MNSSDNMSCTSPTVTNVNPHEFLRATKSASRSPCPALNTLANHGFIHREGKNIGFFELIHALEDVYNASFGLALLLTVAGFVTCGKITFATKSSSSVPTSTPKSWYSSIWNSIPLPRWRLDLQSLGTRGPHHIAHDAALVHPNGLVSCGPDSTLVTQLLSFASPFCSGTSCIRGLSFSAFAHAHELRVQQTSNPLNFLHKQVALGECGLAWAVMRMRPSLYDEDVPVEQRKEILTENVINEWFWQEKLPTNWWTKGRPTRPVGVLEARSNANKVGKLSGTM